ncbi:MAG: J domain-containing protein [Chloroflexota bacterium]|nr:J domain-containing protein [Chloroflexota bacterium]
MVFPIIGARDYIDQRGFFIHDCPSCRRSTVFAAYDTRRKLTLYFIPTMNVRSQLVMECMTCHEKWGVPADQVANLKPTLMTQEQLSEHLTADLPRKAPRRPHGRTFYQVLHVDQEADPEVIDVAFRRLALKHHPDRTSDPASAGRMRDLLAARDVLTDPARRAAYDRSLGIVHQVEALRPEDV